MKRLSMRTLWLVLLLGVVAGSLHSQRPAATFPVIVVFSDTAPFDSFQGAFRADERMVEAPAAWDYLDRRVIGAVQNLERRHGFRAEHVYSAAIRGFSARLTAAQIQAIEALPYVKYVEPDGVMTITAQTLPWGINRIDADISSTRAGDGAADPRAGTVHVYIIDTGIDTTHSDLFVVEHVNFAGGSNRDCNGHGTHVAGTAGARDNTSHVVGVLPDVRLHGVKVLNCAGSGTTSGVIKGVDFVTANAIKPAVANMSLGGGASQALDDAVKRSADSGVFYAVAAGNEGTNACNSSPARAGTHNGVATVAATDSNDREASFSNFGTCVDIWAPGVSILSTWLRNGTQTLSGTSMASPHVAGTGALYQAGAGQQTAANVEAAIKNNAVSTGTTSKDGRAIQLVYAGRF
jgi:subtilisin family serine protease